MKKKKKSSVFSSPVLIERRFRVLTDDECQRIRNHWLTDNWTQGEIAEELQVSTATVSACCRSTPATYYKVTTRSEKLAALRDKRRKIRGGKG